MGNKAAMADEGVLQQDEIRLLKHSPHVMVQTHWHAHVEAFLLTSGRIWTELHGQSTEIGAGRIGLFWASYPHRVTRIEAPGDIYVLNVPMRQFRNWRLSTASRMAVMSGELLLASAPIPYQQVMFETWLGERQSGGADQKNLIFDEAQNCIRRVDQLGWTTTAQRRSHQVGTASSNRRVDDMIRFIDASFQRADLRVADVADVARLHPNYAMAVFKGAMGVSIGNYLTHVRLAEAQQLLLTTNHKILAVADYCGFATPSRFYAAFQSHLGTSPKQYRERALVRDLLS